MTKLNYTLNDIKQYLKQYYNIEWDLKVSDRRTGKLREVNEEDYYGEGRTRLSITALVKHKGVQRYTWLTVSNQHIAVDEINAPLKHWQDFLTKNNCEQNNISI